MFTILEIDEWKTRGPASLTCRSRKIKLFTRVKLDSSATITHETHTHVECSHGLYCRVQLKNLRDKRVLTWFGLENTRNRLADSAVLLCVPESDHLNDVELPMATHSEIFARLAFIERQAYMAAHISSQVRQET